MKIGCSDPIEKNQKAARPSTAARFVFILTAS
jgi:hypothetical protein